MAQLRAAAPNLFWAAGPRLPFSFFRMQPWKEPTLVFLLAMVHLPLKFIDYRRRLRLVLRLPRAQALAAVARRL